MSPGSTNLANYRLRYWTHVTLGRLHRLLAIQEWQKLKFSDDAPESFEISLAAFDMFILNGRQVGDFNDVRGVSRMIQC